MRTVRIAAAHTQNAKRPAFTLPMEGGNPGNVCASSFASSGGTWYAYIWINDVCHVVTIKDGSKRISVRKA